MTGAVLAANWPDNNDEPGPVHWKTRGLVDWAAGRPFVWIDDEITDADRGWVTPSRPAATVDDVHQTVRATGTEDNEPVTTLTAMLRRGSQLALVHIGDTRVYLLRGGELSQLTQDHTWVQTQVEHGNFGPDQAATHPQRALLTRALGTGGRPVEADLALRTAVPGDRYLLCSDGLSAVVNRRDLHAALTEAGEPEPTVQRLIDLTYAAGAPDNITCVVADIVTP